MKKLRQNIITIIVTAAMLLSGNFAYALTHIDCIVKDDTHRKCEMECCKESACMDEAESVAGIAGEAISGFSPCCEVHIEEAVEQDRALLTYVKTYDNLKLQLLNTSIIAAPEFKPEYQRLFTHKFKTTNIYLSVSNLRI